MVALFGQIASVAPVELVDPFGRRHLFCQRPEVRAYIGYLPGFPRVDGDRRSDHIRIRLIRQRFIIIVTRLPDRFADVQIIVDLHFTQTDAAEILPVGHPVDMLRDDDAVITGGDRFAGLADFDLPGGNRDAAEQDTGRKRFERGASTVTVDKTEYRPVTRGHRKFDIRGIRNGHMIGRKHRLIQRDSHFGVVEQVDLSIVYENLQHDYKVFRMDLSRRMASKRPPGPYLRV